MEKIFLFLLFFIHVFCNAQTSDDKFYNLFIQKQYTKILEAIEETNSLDATDFYYAGLSAEVLEDTHFAVLYFKRSIATDSTFTPALISLAQALFQNEEFVDAIEIYTKLLETDTLNVFLWGGLGDCYAKLLFFPLAYSCYRNVFYLNPKNSTNTLKLVSALIASNSKNYLAEALFYCDSSLIYNPSNKPLLRRKASILFSNKEFLQAVPILENLMSQRDSSFIVLKQAGICNALFNKHDAAIVLLRKAHLQSKNDMEVMLHLASSLSNKPEFFDEATEMIYKIRKNIEPDSTIIYYTNTLLAQSYLGIKDTVNAILQYYYSMNLENNDDRLLRMTNLANHVKPTTSHSMLWYTHYYFLQNFKQEYKFNWNLSRQKNFSQSLLKEYMTYMHMTGMKKANWQTFDKKSKTITINDLQKAVNL